MDRHPDEIRPGPQSIAGDRLRLCVEQWRGVEGVAPDLLDLAAWSVSLTRQHAARFAGIVDPLAAGTPAAAAARLAAGDRLVVADDLRIAPAAVLAVVDAVRVRLGSAAGTASAWQNLTGRLPPESAIARELVRLNLEYDDGRLQHLATDCALSAEVLRFVLRHVGMPALAAAAGQFAPLVDDASWRRGHCPICGCGPAWAGLISDSGVRHLACGLCGFVWTFARLRCPSCGNDDSETLPVLAADSQAAHHLDACRRCGFYVKTVDYRKVAAGRAVVLPIDDAATFYLDLLAEKDGLHRA